MVFCVLSTVFDHLIWAGMRRSSSPPSMYNRVTFSLLKKPAHLSAGGLIREDGGMGAGFPHSTTEGRYLILVLEGLPLTMLVEG